MPGAFPLQNVLRALNGTPTGLSGRLGGVQNVGQAHAAVNAALAAASKARVVADHELPSGLAGAFAGSASAENTVKGLDNAVERLKANAAQLGGNASQGVGGSWIGIRDRITNVYGIVFDIYDRAGHPPQFFDGLVADLGRDVEKYSDTLKGKGLLERAGTIIGDVGHQAGKGVGAAGKGIGAGAKDALGPILGELWKPLLGIGVVALVGVGIYVFTLSKVPRIGA